MTDLLSHEEIQTFCSQNGWEANGTASITKLFTFGDYVQALAFVNAVAVIAEEHGHHPDLLLSYGKVTATLSTHDAGGVTELDTALAKRVDSVAVK